MACSYLLLPNVCNRCTDRPCSASECMYAQHVPPVCLARRASSRRRWQVIVPSADGWSPLAHMRAGTRCAGTLAMSTFQVGDRVRVPNRLTIGHTRVPAYIRGAIGHVERVLRKFLIPEDDAFGRRQGRHRMLY